MKNLILIEIVLVACLSSGCDTRRFDRNGNELHVGDLVRHVADDRVGVVVNTRCLHSWGVNGIEVRFPALTITTRTHTFSRDDPLKVSPYVELVVVEQEIEKIDSSGAATSAKENKP